MTDSPINRIIPAAVGANPGIVHVDISGRVLSCLSSTGKFKVRVDNGEQFELSGGRYYGNPEAAEYGRLTFYNYTAAAITIECIAGQKVYKPDGAISSVTANVTTSGKNAATYCRSSQISANDSFSGFDGANARKQIIVQNRGAATVEIEGETGAGKFEIVTGDPAFTMECGGEVKITFGAGAKDARILEIFYAA